MAAKRGRKPVDEDKRREMCSARLPPALLKQFRAACERAGQTKTQVLEKTIRAYLKKHGGKR